MATDHALRLPPGACRLLLTLPPHMALLLMDPIACSTADLRQDSADRVSQLEDLYTDPIASINLQHHVHSTERCTRFCCAQ
jgi:hypothetical protein